MSDYANLREELGAAYDMIEDLESQIPPPGQRTQMQEEAMARRAAKKHAAHHAHRERAHEDARARR